MSSIPIVNPKSSNSHHRHHRLSVQHPTSAVARSPEKPRSGTLTCNSQSATSHKNSPAVQTQPYTQTQQSAVPSEKSTPPPSRDFSPVHRSGPVLPYNQRPLKDDPSGIHQPLHIRNYSTQSSTKIDVATSSNKNRTSTSLPLPVKHHLPKSKTTTHLAKSSLNLTPQRQLMKPIDPPLPRSQTLGSLSYLAVDGTKETPNTAKSDTRPGVVHSGTELSVLDALKESRMTDREIEIYNQVTKEKHLANEQKQQTARQGNRNSMKNTRKFSDSFSMTKRITSSQPDPCSTGTLGKYGNIDVMKNEEMDRKLLRRDRDQRRDGQDLLIDGSADGRSRIDISLTHTIHKPPCSPAALDKEPDNLSQSAAQHVTDDSCKRPCPQPATAGATYHSDLDKEWEVDLKLVYFGAASSYWAGRFSTLCDRLKTADAPLVSSNFDSALAPPFHQEATGAEESFDVAERRRMEYALRELRSYCQTSTALRSFDEFEFELRKNLDKRAEVPTKVAQRPLICPAEQVINAFKPTTASSPKIAWHFGQSQASQIPAKSIAARSIISGKQKAVMVKSKTTSNLASMLDGQNEMATTRNADVSSTSDAKSLPGLSWQRPTIHEAQAQAKRIREQSLFAKAVTFRRGSGQDSGISTRWVGAIDADTNSEESMGFGATQDWQGNELPCSEAKPVAKGGHTRKSSGVDSLSLKKVWSGSMKGMKKVTRSITGSGSFSGNERIID